MIDCFAPARRAKDLDGPTILVRPLGVIRLFKRVLGCFFGFIFCVHATKGALSTWILLTMDGFNFILQQMIIDLYRGIDRLCSVIFYIIYTR